MNIRTDINRDTSDTIREDGRAGAYLLSGKMVDLPTATPERTPTGKMVVLVPIFHHAYQQRHHQGRW
jgi:hypothetical protein